MHDRRALPRQIGFAMGLGGVDAEYSDAEEVQNGSAVEPGSPPPPTQPTPAAPDPAKALRAEAYRHKRRMTTQRWQTEVLPKLLAPYMRLMEDTNNLRNPPKSSTPTPQACTCNGELRRALSILVLRMDSKWRTFAQVPWLTRN